MKKSFLAPLFIAAAVACTSGNKAVISVEYPEKEDNSMVVLSRLHFNTVSPIDTFELKGGMVSIPVEISEGTSDFLYISVDGECSVPLLVAASEKVNIRFTEGGYECSGSDESTKLQNLHKGINAFDRRFDSLSAIAAQAHLEGDVKMEKQLKREMGAMYVSQKRDAIKYIYENPSSLTVLPLLYRNITSELPLFAQNSDVLLMERVYDSLKVHYPSSAYLVSLADEIQLRKGAMIMETYMKEAGEVDFPDIALNDINGRQQILSAYKGNVIALIFWDSENVAQRNFNAELVEIYNKYHKKGFEIYQVSLNSDKTAWALQVKSQQVPWISVCDPQGYLSASALMYNVTNLPAMYLIDKEGTIVGKDIFSITDLDAAVSKAAR